MPIFAFVAELLKRAGTKAIGLGLCALGLAYAASVFINERIALGIAVVLIGLGFYFVGAKQKATTDLVVATEAERRIVSKSLPSESKIPVIQMEIDKQKAGTSRQTVA